MQRNNAEAREWDHRSRWHYRSRPLSARADEPASPNPCDGIDQSDLARSRSRHRSRSPAARPSKSATNSSAPARCNTASNSPPAPSGRPISPSTAPTARLSRDSMIHRPTRRAANGPIASISTAISNSPAPSAFLPAFVRSTTASSPGPHAPNTPATNSAPTAPTGGSKLSISAPRPSSSKAISARSSRSGSIPTAPGRWTSDSASAASRCSTRTAC